MTNVLFIIAVLCGFYVGWGWIAPALMALVGAP
jgi:hypothetical protein